MLQSKNISWLPGCLAFPLLLLPVLIPRLLPWLLVLCGIAAGAAVLRRRDALQAIPGKAIFIALLVLTAYLFVNSSWALNVGAAVQKSGEFTLLVVLMAALTTFLSAMDEASAGRAARWAVAGLVLGLCYLTVEYVLGMPILDFVASHVGQVAHDLAKETLHGGAQGERIDPVTLNRNMAAVSVLLTPALLVCDAFASRCQMPLRIALLLLVGICAWFTSSGTAVTAIALGLAVLLLGRLSLRMVKWAVVSLWIVGMVFAVPLGTLPVKIGAMDWTFFPESSAQARFYIWEYTAEKTKERPLTGIGVRSTRQLQPHVTVEEANSSSYRYRPRPGRHAHNAFLQIWLELGAIGAALVLFFGLAVLRYIAALPQRMARYGYALFASICAVASLGYGIWQSWLLSGFAFAALLYLLGVRLERGQDTGPQGGMIASDP